MKQLVVMVMAAFISCTGQQTTEQQEGNTANDYGDKVVTVRLNNGAKWKADEATKKNVAAMVQLVNDSTYADAGKRQQLYSNLKAKVDLLVKECSMKGAEHDALHVWLETVLEDLKELKEENDKYSEVYTTLKNDIISFDQTFE